jgi:hypothetical protein
MKENNTPMFRFLYGSGKIYNRDEVRSIIAKDPDSLLFWEEVKGVKYFKIKKSDTDQIYTLDEIREIIRKDPKVILRVYETCVGTHPGERMKSTINGGTAELKFG